MSYLRIRANEGDKPLNSELSGSSGYLFHALNASFLNLVHGVLEQKCAFLCECTSIKMSKCRKGGASLDRKEA